MKNIKNHQDLIDHHGKIIGDLETGQYTAAMKTKINYKCKKEDKFKDIIKVIVENKYKKTFK